MKKITTLALTGALALGGLGIGSMADMPGLSATQAEAASISEIDGAYIKSSASYVLNALYVEGWVHSESDGMSDDFQAGQHQARFTIQNTAGTIVKSGTLNAWGGRVDHGLGSTYSFSNDTNISLAGLPKNSMYRVKMIVPMDDGNIIADSAHPGMTKAFTYNADGTVTDFRN